jgi:hypothetical protein
MWRQYLLLVLLVIVLGSMRGEKASEYWSSMIIRALKVRKISKHVLCLPVAIGWVSDHRADKYLLFALSRSAGPIAARR